MYKAFAPYCSFSQVLFICKRDVEEAFGQLKGKRVQGTSVTQYKLRATLNRYKSVWYTNTVKTETDMEDAIESKKT